MEANDVGAGEKLISAAGVVDAAVVLVPPARTGDRDVEDAPIRDAIGTVPDRLPQLIPSDIPFAKAVIRNERAAIRDGRGGGNSWLHSRSVENLGGEAVRVVLYDVLLEFRRLKMRVARERGDGLPYAFIGKEKEETIFKDRATDAAGIVAISLVDPRRAMTGNYGELTWGASLAGDGPKRDIVWAIELVKGIQALVIKFDEQAAMKFIAAAL